MRLFLCVVSLVLTACGAGGNSSITQPDRCSTGTEVVLVRPVPGTTVSHRLSTLKIASSAGITFQNTALLAVSTTGKTSGPKPLVGPVPPAEERKADDKAPRAWPTPTPSPSPSPPPTPTPKPTAPVPFPSPVYYAAHGFDLASGQTYRVQIVRTGAHCQPDTIRNAQFKTRQVGK